jgi:ribosomal protein S18 acetylase RimI-like enzyme
MSIVIRPAGADSDAGAIHGLRGGDVPDDEQLGQYLVAVDDDSQNSIIGCVRVRKVSFYQAEIMHLFVHEAYRRQGIARKLLDAALAKARERGLPYMQSTIRADNAAMIALNWRAGGIQQALIKSPVSAHLLLVYTWVDQASVPRTTVEPGTYADWRRDAGHAS